MVGSTNPEPGVHDYPAGSEITVTASPAIPGTIFDKLVVDGEVIKDTSVTLTMDQDHEVYAYFIPAQFMAISAGAIIGIAIYLLKRKG